MCVCAVSACVPPVLCPLFSQRYLPDAVEVFQSAVARNGSSVAAKMGLAASLYQRGPAFNAAALSACLSVLALDGGLHGAVALAGLLEGEAGQVDAALQHLRHAVDLSPSSALYRFGITPVLSPTPRTLPSTPRTLPSTPRTLPSPHTGAHH